MINLEKQIQNMMWQLRKTNSKHDVATDKMPDEVL